VRNHFHLVFTLFVDVHKFLLGTGWLKREYSR